MPDIDFHPLFTQLQTRYPTSSLLTELLQIHDGSFVVRALVQVSEATLVTSMAAATTIEQAEDQARARVLKLLGIGSGSALEYERQAATVNSSPRSLDVVPLSIASLPPLPEFQELPKVAASSGSDFEQPSLPAPPAAVKFTLPDPARDRPPEVASIASDRNGKSGSVPDSIGAKMPDLPNGEPIDLTPLFLQIEDEMERIGWTREQGRKHLMRVYNKKSRQQLTDDEIMDFLAYLQVHPPAGEALFRE